MCVSRVRDSSPALVWLPRQECMSARRNLERNLNICSGRQGHKCTRSNIEGGRQGFIHSQRNIRKTLFLFLLKVY